VLGVVVVVFWAEAGSRSAAKLALINVAFKKLFITFDLSLGISLFSPSKLSRLLTNHKHWVLGKVARSEP